MTEFGQFAGISHPKKRAFLVAYGNVGTITAAAQAAGMTRQTHRNWLKDDPAYAEAFAHAEEMAAEALESEARKRAFAGSDTLLIFLLKGAKPEKYADRVNKHVTGSMKHEHRHMDEREMARRLRADPEAAAAAALLAERLET